jgi:hypothetical protein
MISRAGSGPKFHAVSRLSAISIKNSALSTVQHKNNTKVLKNVSAEKYDFIGHGYHLEQLLIEESF